MTHSETETSTAHADPVITAIKSLEEDISNTVRGDRLTNRLSNVSDAAVQSKELRFAQQLEATSIPEIEKLISELQAARNYLKAEVERIHRDMARFTHLNDTALASVKVITESLGQWRKGEEAERSTDRSDAA